MAARIVPRSEAPGVDFCGGVSGEICIIRSDLKCYMTVADLHTGKDATLHSLHPSCSGGDHYFAIYSNPGIGASRTSYYIVKGNEFREVSDLTNDTDPRMGVLHERCQGGDFYVATAKFFTATYIRIFIIVFIDKGILRVVTDLETGQKDAALVTWEAEYNLNKEMLDGLYFFGTKTKTAGKLAFYVIKPYGKWGLQYYCSDDMGTDGEKSGQTSSVHPSVTNFLPGGLGITAGPTVGSWKLIESFTNHSTGNLEGLTCEVSKTVGYNRQALSSIERNWSTTTSVSTEASAGIVVEKVFEAAVRNQFSLSQTYGGKSVQTTSQDWRDEETIKETYDIGKFAPGRSVYIWQYKISLRDIPDILQSRNWAFTDTATPPTSDPFEEE